MSGALIAGAFFSSLIKGMGSILTEESNYQNDLKSYNLYTSQQDRYIEQQKANLDMTKKSTAVSAMAGAVDRILMNINNAGTVDLNQISYSQRLTQYTNQYADQIGSSLALSGTTGFRKSGSNMNRYNKSARDMKYNMDYLRLNMKMSMESEGYSSIKSQINNMDTMAGYRFNIQNAITQTNMLIDEANAKKADRREELGIDKHDERLLNAFWSSFIGTAVTYGADAMITKIESSGYKTEE